MCNGVRLITHKPSLAIWPDVSFPHVLIVETQGILIFGETVPPMLPVRNYPGMKSGNARPQQTPSFIHLLTLRQFSGEIVGFLTHKTPFVESSDSVESAACHTGRCNLRRSAGGGLTGWEWLHWWSVVRRVGIVGLARHVGHAAVRFRGERHSGTGHDERH